MAMLCNRRAAGTGTAWMIAASFRPGLQLDRGRRGAEAEMGVGRADRFVAHGHSSERPNIRELFAIPLCDAFVLSNALQLRLQAESFFPEERRREQSPYALVSDGLFAAKVAALLRQGPQQCA
jgi:hypothetical protein